MISLLRASLVSSLHCLCLLGPVVAPSALAAETTPPAAEVIPAVAGAGPWELLGPGYKLGTGISTQVSIHPSKPAEMLLATRPFGMHLSEDGGKTWKRTGTPFDAGMNQGPNWGLVRAPSNPEIVYVSLENPGIWRSEDGGRTWVDRSATLPGGRAKRGVVVVVHPTDPERVWMGTDGGIFTTKDGGKQWRLLSKGLPPGKVVGDKDRHQTVCALQLDPRNPDHLLLGLYATGHGEPAGVWRSEDGGETWSASSAGIDVPPSPAKSEEPKDELQKLKDLQRPDWIFWLVQARSAPDIVFVRAGSGLYRSEDTGKSWKKLPAIEAHQGFVVDPGDPQRLVIAGKDGGAWLSDDGGNSWRDLSLGLPRGRVAGSKDQEITFKLPDGTAMKVNAHLRSENNVIESFAFAPDNHLVLYASAVSGLYRITLPPRLGSK